MLLNPGDKVHYMPSKKSFIQKTENGIVKRFDPEFPDVAFVVYYCSNDWKNFKDYTAQCTKVVDLALGWTKD